MKFRAEKEIVVIEKREMRRESSTCVGFRDTS